MDNFIDRFETRFNQFSVLIAGFVAISIGSFAILIPLDLLIRSLGWGNMPWLHEGIEYLLYTGVFLGAPWVLQQGAHVRVDVVAAYLPNSIAVPLEKLLDIIGMVICLVLVFYGVQATIEAFIDRSMPDKLLKIANWWMLLVFTISFVLVAIEFMLRLRRADEDLETAEDKPTEAGF